MRHGMYSDGRDIQADGQTDKRYITPRFPPDAASVTMNTSGKVKTQNVQQTTRKNNLHKNLMNEKTQPEHT